MKPENNNNKIGQLNEKSLHAAIKTWYAKPGDKLEERVGNYIIDIVRNKNLIEIQTKNLYKIKKKVLTLSKKYPVRIVVPVALEKYITRLPEGGNEVLSRRKSTKPGNLMNIFDELVHIPDIINQKNVTLEVLLISEEVILRNDGKGSWRRKKASIEDHTLAGIKDSVVFKTKKDFKRFLPDGLTEPFTNSELASAAGISRRLAVKITYSLKKMGLIFSDGKKSRELLYKTAL